MIETYSVLPALGWNNRWSALFAEISHDAVPGRVVRRDRGFATITTEPGTVSSQLLDRFGHVVTGDWVAVTTGTISDVLPRKGAVRRRGPDGVEQVIAANVDVVLLVCGMDRPVKAGRIQRGAIAAWDANASPTVILNKADLGPTREIRAGIEAENPGLEVIEVSTLTGEGLENVRRAIGGGTTVLLGESGAGKSSLLNALAGNELAAMGAVREGDFKGKHTTTRRELYVIPGAGVIIDTPGTRAFGLAADKVAVNNAFEDIEKLAEGCRFFDCGHDTEPGCAVTRAIKSGALHPKRLYSFNRLQGELAVEVIRTSPHEKRRNERRNSKVVQETIRLKRGEQE